jgi:hypothetical protein
VHAAARFNGATNEEIREAVAVAAITRHWSTMLNGMQEESGRIPAGDRRSTARHCGTDESFAQAVKSDPLTATDELRRLVGRNGRLICYNQTDLLPSVGIMTAL